MTLAAPLLGPVLRAQYRQRAEEADEIAPRPEDEPHAEVAGPDPLRVLILGGGPAVGYGVRSHASALPGQVARGLAARTGRGAVLDARVAPGARIADAALLLDERGARGYDAVVHVAGFADACFGSASRRPSRDLWAVVDLLRATGGPDLAIVLAGIEPPVGRYDDRLGRLLAARVEAVNEQIAAMADQARPAAYVRIPARTEAFPYRTASGYREAATAVTAGLVDALGQASAQAAACSVPPTASARRAAVHR